MKLATFVEKWEKIERTAVKYLWYIVLIVYQVTTKTVKNIQQILPRLPTLQPFSSEITAFPQLAHENNSLAQGIEIIQPNGQRTTSINTTTHTVGKLPITAYNLIDR